MAFVSSGRRRSLAAVLLMSGSFQGFAAPPPPAPCPEEGAALYAPCAACHGNDGAGKNELSSPALAGLTEAQLLRQLRHFATGQRGAHPADTSGAQMAAMAKTLPDDTAIKAVACHVARLPQLNADSAPPLQLSGGRAAEGAKTFGFCAGCHGADARGSVAVGAPGLVFQSDAYLLRQLQAFQQGWRGHDVNDEPGTQMVNAAEWVRDEQARRDVLAYLATLRAAKP
jgi:cytochrome c oxidase subunit 2